MRRRQPQRCFPVQLSRPSPLLPHAAPDQVDQNCAAQRHAQVQRRRPAAAQQPQPLHHLCCPAAVAVGVGVEHGGIAAAAGCRGQRWRVGTGNGWMRGPACCRMPGAAQRCGTPALARDVWAVDAVGLNQGLHGLQHEGARRRSAVPQHQRRRVGRAAHRHVRPPQAGGHPALLVRERQGRESGVIVAPQLHLASGASVQRWRLRWCWCCGLCHHHCDRQGSTWKGAGTWLAETGGGGGLRIVSACLGVLALQENPKLAAESAKGRLGRQNRNTQQGCVARQFTPSAAECYPSLQRASDTAL